MQLIGHSHCLCPLLDRFHYFRTHLRSYIEVDAGVVPLMQGDHLHLPTTVFYHHRTARLLCLGINVIVCCVIGLLVHQSAVEVLLEVAGVVIYFIDLVPLNLDFPVQTSPAYLQSKIFIERHWPF